MKDDRIFDGAGRKIFGPTDEKSIRPDSVRRGNGYKGAPSDDFLISQAGRRSSQTKNPPFSERAGVRHENTSENMGKAPADSEKREAKRPPQTTKSKDDYRREHVRRTRKLRKRKILISSVLAFIAALGIITAASYTVLFKIDTVNIEGKSRYSIEQILEASEITAGDNLLGIKGNEVSSRIESRLPYIGKVTLKKELPSKITVCVEEAKEAYSVKDGKTYIKLDESGKILAMGVKSPGNTKTLIGIKPISPTEGKLFYAQNSSLYEQVLHVIKSLEGNGIGIIKVDAADENNIKIFTNMKLRLDFGSLTDSEEKIRMSVVTVKKLIEENSVEEGTINVKTPSKAFYMNETTEPVTQKPTEKADEKTTEGKTEKQTEKPD